MISCPQREPRFESIAHRRHSHPWRGTPRDENDRGKRLPFAFYFYRGFPAAHATGCMRRRTRAPLWSGRILSAINLEARQLSPRTAATCGPSAIGRRFPTQCASVPSWAGRIRGTCMSASTNGKPILNRRLLECFAALKTGEVALVWTGKGITAHETPTAARLSHFASAGFASAGAGNTSILLATFHSLSESL